MAENPKPRLRILDGSGCRRVHEAVLEILEKTGVNVQDDDTRHRLKDIGCRENRNGHVRFDKEAIQAALATVPERMVLFDRGGRKAVDTGDRTPRFCPGINCIDVLDHRTGEIRPCLLDDVVRTARVCERLENIDMAANLGNPGDVPVDRQAMASVRALVGHSQKPLAFIGHDEKEARQLWEVLAQEAGGWQALAAKPFALELTGPTSPLTIKAESCRRLRFAAEKCLPVVCYPALFPGITGPMTLAGAIAQSSAEILAGIVIHQMERPGAPVISGSAVIPMDMRTVNLAYGSPEYVLVGIAAVDYFHAIGVPTWIGAGCTDAHMLDAQAFSEAAAGMFLAVVSGTSFIHNLGFLSSGKTGSLEMLVFCDELAAMAKQVAAGIPVNADTLAVDVTTTAGLNGEFLKHPHTRSHVRSELWLPTLMQRFIFSTWRDQGGPSTQERVRDRLEELLET